jgi:hypothetical protein
VDGGRHSGESRGGEPAAGNRGHSKSAAAVVWGGRRGLSVVWSVRLSNGAHVVLFIFHFIQNWLNLEIEKEAITLLQKFSNFTFW